MKKIIVPVDFSEYSEYALDFALQFSKLIDGKITLLHVLELPAASVNYGADMTAATAEVVYRRELLDGVSEKLHALAEKAEEDGQKVFIRTEYGTPFKSIGKEVAEKGADWVIIGSKGASGLSEVFLGSNAERVIRHAECPVITIKDKVDISSIKNMVFPSDLSKEQEPVAEWAQKFQKLLDINMHVLRVKTPHNFLTEQEAKEQIAEFSKKMGLEDFTSNTIEAEYAEDGIVKFAEDIKAGIIVMGTHGRTGIAHLFGGSRAEDVANHSKIPVLTFRIG